MLLFPCYYFSQFSVPKGFSEFAKSPANGENSERIIADFDKDGKEDIFTIIREDKKEFHNAKKYLIIYLSSKDRVYYLDFDMFYGVYFMPLKYRNGVLEFWVTEEGTGVRGHGLKLRFNPKVKDIQLIGYDYSYRVPGGHCNKTYNLLTGDYTVTNDFYNMKTNKTEFEQFKGNQKLEKNIFIKNFSEKLFEDLSSVGKKYERD